MFNNKFSSFLFHFSLFCCLYNISRCLTPEMRKQILNYFLEQESSTLEFDEKLKDDKIEKALTFIPEESLLFQKYLKAAFESSNGADPNCIDYLITTYGNSIFPSMKLIRDSSYSIGKLGSYQDCKYKIYYDSNNESLSSQNISYNL